jgi:hypothetical protein
MLKIFVNKNTSSKKLIVLGTFIKRNLQSINKEGFKNPSWTGQLGKYLSNYSNNL